VSVGVDVGVAVDDGVPVDGSVAVDDGWLVGGAVGLAVGVAEAVAASLGSAVAVAEGADDAVPVADTGGVTVAVVDGAADAVFVAAAVGAAEAVGAVVGVGRAPRPCRWSSPHALSTTSSRTSPAAKCLGQGGSSRVERAGMRRKTWSMDSPRSDGCKVGLAYIESARALTTTPPPRGPRTESSDRRHRPSGRG
jgi:hypothetical protein